MTLVLNTEVVNRGIGIGRSGGSLEAAGAFRFVDLEVNASVIFCPNDLQKDADSASGLTLATNDVTHILWIDVEGDENATFIDNTIGLNVFRVVDDLFDHVLDKCLVLFHVGHNCSYITKHFRLVDGSLDLPRCRGLRALD